MAENKNDGGPAFPEAVAISPAGDLVYGFAGMSLRDWFAGQALSGLMASKAISGTADSPEIIAERKRKAVSCYLLADAMLAERAKPTPSDE